MDVRWIILLYHDVSWEDNAFMNRIGGTCPPDVFRDHLEVVSKYGKIVSIKDGLDLTLKSQSSDIFFSFWFDDGFRGVRKYAMPLLAEHQATGALSICSKFVSNEDLFWRSKLSFIASIDGLRFLRSKLSTKGYRVNMSVNKFLLDNFDQSNLEHLNNVYDKFTNKALRKDAFRLFDDMEGIKELHNKGWVIANHSSSHFPISEENYIDKCIEEFEECDNYIHDLLGYHSKYWVIPFDRQGKRTDKFNSIIKSKIPNNYVVYVSNKINSRNNLLKNNIYRFGGKIVSKKLYSNYLENILANF